MKRPKSYIPVQTYLTALQKVKIEQIALARRMTVSELVREIINNYLKTVDQEFSHQHDSLIIDEIRRAEERLVRLHIKTMRGLGETRYMVYQQWVHGGPPPDGLTEEEKKDLLNKSKQFSLEWLQGKDQQAEQ